MMDNRKSPQTDNSSLSFNFLDNTGVIGTGYFCSARFSDEVCSTVAELVTCTRVLWQKTKVTMDVVNTRFRYCIFKNMIMIRRVSDRKKCGNGA